MSASDNQPGLAQRIRTVLGLAPEKGAIEFQERWYSWGQLAGAMQQLESLFAQAVGGEGAPVAILVRNRPAHFAALLQIIVSRRCVVMVNPFQSAEKVAADLKGLQVAALLADTEDCELAAVRAALQQMAVPVFETGWAGAMSVRALDVAAKPPGYPLHTGIAVRMLTSGTTGASKRIDLSYVNLERSQLDALFYEAGASHTEVRLRDAVVIAMTPLVHIGGLWGAIAAIISGRSICLLEKFSVPEWRRAVVTHRPKVVSMPPTALRMIFDANVPKEELTSILAVRAGTAAMPVALQDAFEERYGIPILDSYGATEFAGAVAGWTITDHRKFARTKRGSAGRAQPGCELRVVDRNSFEVLAAGQVGLLEVRVAKQMGPDWIRTNDLASIDADGFLFLRGRADDAIVRGGFKVLPAEVVSALLQHPAVKDAGVVGLPDERLGAVPVAAVELQPGAIVTEKDLLAFLRARLVAYQVPTQIRILTSLPRTPSMKVSQPQLRELFAVSAEKA